MTAKQLRDAGLLWPECLTDAELRLELRYHEERAEIMPISWRMLTDERTRRGWKA